MASDNVQKERMMYKGNILYTKVINDVQGQYIVYACNIISIIVDVLG